MPFGMDAKFKAWPALNDESLWLSVGVTSRSRLQADLKVEALFRGDTLQARFSRALADRKAVDRKEFFVSPHAAPCIRAPAAMYNNIPTANPLFRPTRHSS